MGPVALDASVVIGFLGKTDAHHVRAVEAFRELGAARTALQIAASAYAEVLVQPFRDGRTQVVEDFLRQARVDVKAIDRRIAQMAGELRAEHRSLRLGDALVLASARVHEAELLTFDERLNRLARG